MADDLVTRLRDFPVRDCCSQRAEAADRIEQLEAALRRIAAMTPDPEFGTPPIDSAIDVARAALEGRDETAR